MSTLTTNATSLEDGAQKKALQEALNALGMICFFLFMLGLGCSIRFQQFKQKIRKPKGLLIGMFCQFIFMPFFTWLSAVSFSLEATAGVALCIVGTCPGGALSNMLCYMLHSDIALSVAMTTASSVVAFIMLPINIKIYIDVLGVGVVEEGGKRLTSDDLELEWGKILLSTLIVVAGTMSGMATNKYFPKVARKAETAGMACGIAMLAISSYQNMDSGVTLSSVGVDLFVAVLIPTLGGLFAGIGMARLAGLPRPSCVAVGMESSLQNAVLALAIIQFSMGGDKYNEEGFLIEQSAEDKAAYARALTVPILYGCVSATCDIILGLALWKLSWTRAPASARPLRDFGKNWKRDGLKHALSLSHEKLKAMHLEAVIQDLEQEEREREEFERSGGWSSPLTARMKRNKVSPSASNSASPSIQVIPLGATQIPLGTTQTPLGTTQTPLGVTQTPLGVTQTLNNSPKKASSPKKRKLSLPGDETLQSDKQHMGNPREAQLAADELVDGGAGTAKVCAPKQQESNAVAMSLSETTPGGTLDVLERTDVTARSSQLAPLSSVRVSSGAQAASGGLISTPLNESESGGTIDSANGLKTTQSLGQLNRASEVGAPPKTMQSLGSTRDWISSPKKGV